MTYYYISSTDAGPLTETLYDTCTLLGTTAANCHATVAVTVAQQSTTSPSTFVITEAVTLGYAQIPITAGPAAALRSVSSCSANSGVAPSSTQDTTVTASSGVPSDVSSTQMAYAVPVPGPGQSTGAKVGIGVGVGVGGAALLVVGGVFLYWRRKRQVSPKSHQQSMASAPNLDHPQAQSSQQGPYELEQPTIKHEKPVGRQVQELPGQYGSYELPTNHR